MLRSDLCGFSDAYIVVKGIVTVSADERDRHEVNRQVILKKNAPFISGIPKINGVLVENIEDLDIVINSKPFEHKTSITGSKCNVPRRITGADSNPANNPNYDRNKRGTREVEIAVPLKHLGNF